MPLYEYECDACRRRFEVIQKFSDPAVETCTQCGEGPVRRLLSSPAIQFKGSGWYITDYAQKGKSDKSEQSGASAGKSEGGKAEKTDATAGKTEKKTDAASSSPTPPSTAKT